MASVDMQPSSRSRKAGWWSLEQYRFSLDQAARIVRRNAEPSRLAAEASWTSEPVQAPSTREVGQAMHEDDEADSAELVIRLINRAGNGDGEGAYHLHLAGVLVLARDLPNPELTGRWPSYTTLRVAVRIQVPARSRRVTVGAAPTNPVMGSSSVASGRV